MRAVRMGLGALGAAVMAYALVGAGGDPDIMPRRHAGFLLTVLLLHDAALLPGFVLVGLLVRRLVPVRYRGIVQGALAVTAAVTLVALPLVLGYGRTADNPSALPRDYPAGLALVLGAVWTAAAVAMLLTRMRRAHAVPPRPGRQRYGAHHAAGGTRGHGGHPGGLRPP